MMIKAQEMIPVAGPWITDREVDYAADAARNAWYTDHYRFNADFEAKFSDYIGVKFAASLPHCTSGLHLACAALGIGEGDEVIAPDVTWIASVAPITYVGAIPILVDINPDTWCLDPEAVEAAITTRTRAILGVDLYGSMADWSRLRDIADRHGLYLIEDAAEALGSRYHNRPAGAFGDISAFSFHGSKTLTTGEGGMITTERADLFERIQTLRDHGRAPGDRFFQNNEIAFKYKMSAMQAAVGLAQIERIDELIAYKRKIFEFYRDHLGEIDGLKLNSEPDNTFNSYWMVTVVPDDRFGIDKFELQAALRSRNIDSRPFFSPLSELKAFETRPESCKHVSSNSLGRLPARTGVNLPSGYHVTEEEVNIVCGALKEILGLA